LADSKATMARRLSGGSPAAISCADFSIAWMFTGNGIGNS